MTSSISPLYSAATMERPAFQLRYTWTGWPSTGNHFPMRPAEEFFKGLGQRWETDGIRFLECVWSSDQIQLTCSVKPHVNPILFTARIKGRLQHALRATEQSTAFSRKVSFRSIGNNSRKEVEGYIAKQVQKEMFVDPRFSHMLESFTVANPQARLDEPVETGSGRYWYNLHLVVVTNSRLRFTDDESLARLSRLCDAIAKKKRHRVSARSVMPDHIHIALGGNIDQSPEEIALAYMNNTAYSFGQKSIWRPSYYIGSFGEYDMGAVRSASHSNLHSCQTSWQGTE